MAVDIFGMPDELYADVRYQHEGAVSDDNFYIALYYADGKKVALTASKYAREPLPFMTLHGKRGSYVKQNADNQEALLLGGAQPVGAWNREPEDEWGILHTEIDGWSSAKKSKASAEIMRRFMKTFMTRCKANLPQRYNRAKWLKCWGCWRKYMKARNRGVG